MALTLQPDPEMEQTLTEQARRQGVSVEAFIEEILARQIGLQDERTQTKPRGF